MCAIIGLTRRALPEERVRACFARTRSRGPDMERLWAVGPGYLGFQRLAIMGLEESGMQPFRLGESACVCNGELYGFRALKEELLGKGYRFQSGSDCELLLPLYREYGLGMFERLDAEFALILYDGETGRFICARDPIGIRPLYYGELPGGGLAFASEPKDLLGLCGKIMPFPPGHYYDGERFVAYADMGRVERYHTGPLEEICKGIHDRLVKAVEKRLDADAPVGFLLSGGLDSSLVCGIAAGLMKQPIRTFAIGMDKDAIDLRYARQAAEFMGARHTEILMTRRQVLDSLREVIGLLGTWDITTIRASMGMYLCCKAIHETTNVRVLLTGEISDELFGYKYTDYAPSAQAFQEEAAKRLRELHMYDVLRADRCISVNSMEARVPFGDLEFARYVMGLDPALKLNRYGMGKYLLRKAFEKDRLLPEGILWRQKAAFSDAVGHSMVDDLKDYAESAYTEEEFQRKRQAYSHGRPFTKESLLYREIFESFYPGQGDMIADFWMPNRQWKGCNVDDPSARVLANYGESGQ